MSKKYTNQMKLTIPALSCNESFARAAISAFVAQLDPTIDELADVRTALSEAVTNAIIHAYKGKQAGNVNITAQISENEVYIKIRDNGCGISDIEQAMQPLYTTGDSDRAGLGFAVMQSFMDNVKVQSKVGKGTCVHLKKKLRLHDNESLEK